MVERTPKSCGFNEPLGTLRIASKMKDLLIYSAYYWCWFAFHSKVEDPQVEQIS